MLNIFMKILYFIIGVLLLVGAIFSIGNVLSGGSIAIGSRYSLDVIDPEMSGFVAVLFLIVVIIAALCLLKWVFSSPKDVADRETNTVPQKYPYCRWWKDGDVWHSEENPVRNEVYPNDGSCPYCAKKIEIIKQ